MSDLIAWLRAQMDDNERDWTPYLIGPAQIGNPTARQILADVAAKRAIIDAWREEWRA